VSVAGTFGDLTVSSVKRSAGGKESGHLIPGHGGALDRFDSALFIIPLAYAFLKLIL
jgi:phosphatidate cytidylyltransferase